LSKNKNKNKIHKPFQAQKAWYKNARDEYLKTTIVEHASMIDDDTFNISQDFR